MSNDILNNASGSAIPVDQVRQKRPSDQRPIQDDSSIVKFPDNSEGRYGFRSKRQKSKSSEGLQDSLVANRLRRCELCGQRAKTNTEWARWKSKHDRWCQGRRNESQDLQSESDTLWLEDNGNDTHFLEEAGITTSENCGEPPMAESTSSKNQSQCCLFGQRTIVTQTDPVNICTRQDNLERLREARHDYVNVEDLQVSTGNPVEELIKEYISQHPVNNTQLTDLLRILHKLSHEHIPYIQQLPRTAQTWRRQAHKLLNETVSSFDKMILKEKINVGKGTVEFAHFDLWDMVAGLLVEDENLHWDYKDETLPTNAADSPEQLQGVISELYTAKWWEATAIVAAAKGCKLLSIILYTDGIVVDWAGKINLTPIMMTLGNFELHTQRSLKGKRLLGFIPQLSVGDHINLFGNMKFDAAECNRLVLHSCLGWFLSEITKAQQLGGVRCRVSDEEILCYPAVPFIICDNKEAHALAHIKLNTKHRPCRFCTANEINMHNFDPESSSPLRSFEELTQMMHDKEWCKNNSVYSDMHKSCILLNFDAFGNHCEQYFAVLPPDLLHTVYAGVVRFSVCWALSVLKRSSKTHHKQTLTLLHKDIEKFNVGSPVDSEYMFSLPAKFSISEIVKHVSVGPDKASDDVYTSKFESSKWISLAIALFGVLLLDQTYLKDFQTRKTVLTALLHIINLTFELRRAEYTTRNLTQLRMTIIPNALSALQDLYLLRQQLKQSRHLFSGIKMHIIMHLDHLIAWFGTPRVWDTDTFESAHKEMVKQLYRRSSKRTPTLEMELLAQYVEKGPHSLLEMGIRSENKPPPQRLLHTKKLRQTGLVMYSWNRQGYKVEHLSDSNFTLSAMVRNKTYLVDDNEKSFKPHSQLRTLLRRCLVDYVDKVEQGNEFTKMLRDYLYCATRDSSNVTLRIHDHVQIKGSGQLQGYKDFNIYANQYYGEPSGGNLRPRFDVVELAIETSAGGAIAASKLLLRPTNSTDRAFAHVLAIVSVWFGDHCTPFFLVKFFRKVQPRPKIQNSAYILESVNIQEQVHVGDYGGFGAALYPISSLVAPALSLLHKQLFLIFPLKFFSRSRWLEEDEKNISYCGRGIDILEYTLNDESSDLERWSDISDLEE